MTERSEKSAAPKGSSGHSKVKKVAATAAAFGGVSGHSTIRKVAGTAVRTDKAGHSERRN